MNIRTGKDYKNSKKLSMINYGLSGVGKSNYSLENLKRAVLINYEDGIGDIKISPDLTILDCKNASDFREAIEYIEDNKDKFDTVVLDSITKYGDKLFAAVSEIYPDKKDGLNLWGMIDTVSRQRFEQLMSLDMNIIIIALEEQVVLESGFRGSYPSYKAKKFKASLEAQVDIICHLFKDDKGNYMRDWNGDNVAIGKNRFPNSLGNNANAYKNVQEVIDKLKGE
jgi:hypothetical protein